MGGVWLVGVRGYIGSSTFLEIMFNLFQSGTIYSHHATGLVYAPFQFLIVSFINWIDP